MARATAQDITISPIESLTGVDGAAPATRRAVMKMIVRSTAAVAAVPTIAQANPLFSEATQVDPIMAAIKRHRRALDVVEATEREISRLYELADEMAGPSYIPVLDMRQGPIHLYEDAYSVSDISDLVPGLDNQELLLFYLDKFETQMRERSAVHGDTDALMKEPAADLWAAEEALCETVPATLPGLLALLDYLGTAVTANPFLFEEEQRTILMANVGKGARQLQDRIN